MPPASFFALADCPPAFFFLGLSDSEADEAELLVVLVTGAALVLGRLDGAFFGFFFDLSSELLEAEDAELLELFLDLEESWELEESSESLELSSLPDDDEDDELDDELPEDELPDDAEEEALLDPARLGGIFEAFEASETGGTPKVVCLYFDANSPSFQTKINFRPHYYMAEWKVGCLGNMADLSAIWCCARQMTLTLFTFSFANISQPQRTLYFYAKLRKIRQNANGQNELRFA